MSREQRGQRSRLRCSGETSSASLETRRETREVVHGVPASVGGEPGKSRRAGRFIKEHWRVNSGQREGVLLFVRIGLTAPEPGCGGARRKQRCHGQAVASLRGQGLVRRQMWGGVAESESEQGWILEGEG